MKPSEIKAEKIYQGHSTHRLRRVMDVAVSNGRLFYREADCDDLIEISLKAFARWARREVTKEQYQQMLADKRKAMKNETH